MDITQLIFELLTTIVNYIPAKYASDAVVILALVNSVASAIALFWSKRPPKADSKFIIVYNVLQKIALNPLHLGAK